MTLDEVNGVIELSAGGVKVKFKYDALGGIWSNEVGASKKLGLITFSGSCGSDGECRAGSSVGGNLGPVGLGYNPVSGDASASVNSGLFGGSVSSSGQTTLSVGPNGNILGVAKAKAVAEAKMTFDSAAFMSVLLREIERQSGGYSHMPPNVADFLNDNVRVKLHDGKIYSLEELYGGEE